MKWESFLIAPFPDLCPLVPLLCNVIPLEHHFYNSKTGVYRGIPNFLILFQNIDCEIFTT